MKNQTSKANTAAAQMPELSHWRDRNQAVRITAPDYALRNRKLAA